MTDPPLAYAVQVANAGTPELWALGEGALKRAVDRLGIEAPVMANEAAFYGPKIDVQVWSAIGREFTIATNQVDFAQPKRFGLTYKTRDNKTDAMAFIVRRSAPTNFIGFPSSIATTSALLAPEQVRILPIGDEAPPPIRLLTQTELRSPTSPLRARRQRDHIKAKTANEEQMKVHTMLVIGNRTWMPTPSASAFTAKVTSALNRDKSSRRSCVVNQRRRA